jgi:hypothetical protein
MYVCICMYVYVCMYVYSRVCCCERVRSRAGADDALMRGMCASAARSLRNAIHLWNTHITVYVYPMHACSCIHAASYTDERIADAGPPHTRAHVLRPCARARVCACAIGRARIRADACERLRSAWTADGSARRHFTRRRRSTRTSARGTPLRSPFCPMYAPPFRPGGAPVRAGRARRAFDAARAVVRGSEPPMRARACVRRHVGTRKRGSARV